MQSISSEAESLHQNPERANPGPTMFGLKCPLRKSVLRQKGNIRSLQTLRAFWKLSAKHVARWTLPQVFLAAGFAPMELRFSAAGNGDHRRLLASGTPWENAAVKPVQAETSAGPILPTPGVAVCWDVANLAKKKEFGNCRQDGSEAGVFFFWETRDPPKVTSEASELLGSEL